MARIGGDLISREPVLCDSVEVTAGCAETTDYFKMAVFCSKMQWSGTILGCGGRERREMREEGERQGRGEGRGEGREGEVSERGGGNKGGVCEERLRLDSTLTLKCVVILIPG